MGKINKRRFRISKQKTQTADNSETKIATKPKPEGKDLLHKTRNSIKTKSKSKKEKLRQKHKTLMNKFALLKKNRKEEMAKKNRERTALIGDLKPLKDALPSLDELYKIRREESLKTCVREFDKPPKKLSMKQKIRRKRESFINKVNTFQSALNDPDFKKNPRDAISYHIKHSQGLTTD